MLLYWWQEVLNRAVCHARKPDLALAMLLKGTGEAVHTGMGIGQTICMVKHPAQDSGAHSDLKVNRQKASMLLLACFVCHDLPQPVGQHINCAQASSKSSATGCSTSGCEAFVYAGQHRHPWLVPGCHRRHSCPVNSKVCNEGFTPLAAVLLCVVVTTYCAGTADTRDMLFRHRVQQCLLVAPDVRSSVVVDASEFVVNAVGQTLLHMLSQPMHTTLTSCATTNMSNTRIVSAAESLFTVPLDCSRAYLLA